jgi:hypothetical protein
LASSEAALVDLIELLFGVLLEGIIVSILTYGSDLMLNHSTKLALRWVGIFGVLVAIFYLSNSGLAGTVGAGPSGDRRLLLATSSPTPTPPPPQFVIHFPNVIRHALGPRVELISAWMTDEAGNPGDIFLVNEDAQYIARFFNASDKSLKVGLRWTQSGPCGEISVFNGSITLAPGEQQRAIAGVIPDCAGLHTVTVYVTDQGSTVSMSTLMVANPLSLVAVENQQGFDKCAVPTISQMQTWWNDSPYYAVNMYIGGVSRACDQVNLTPYWMNAVSQQGWTFIPTWVGPQAPCTTYRHRISSNKATAYSQGKDEAEMAASTAFDLGLWGDFVIYYDLEGYSGDSACRDAVASFVNGWVERLHELGYQAGVYGSPCRSYIADWSQVDSVPDDVWIASWVADYYDRDATVWLSGDAERCLSDTLWSNHQRIRQYTGGHAETYGGLTFSIDSNALDGEVTVLPTPRPTQAAGSDPAQSLSDVSRDQVRRMQPLNVESGWALLGERLLLTRDGGASWQDITPPAASPAHLLAVTFTNPQQGWVVRQSEGGNDKTSLEILVTQDGGLTWQEFSLAVADASDDPPIAEGYLTFLDGQTGFLSAKLESSSAFSLGRLFATQDGGLTWEERSLPLGEPVAFVDAQRGWVAGGPGGDQLFRTLDGGRTWQPQALTLPFSAELSQAFFGLPVFRNPVEGSLPVTVTGLDPRLLVYVTGDGGETWTMSGQIELAAEPGLALPFSAGPAGGWWAAMPGGTRLSASTAPGSDAVQINGTGLPSGVIDLDFLDSQAGWALAQTSVCRGEKASLGAEQMQPLRCAAQTYLLRTVDGGQTWQEITP